MSSMVSPIPSSRLIRPTAMRSSIGLHDEGSFRLPRVKEDSTGRKRHFDIAASELSNEEHERDITRDRSDAIAPKRRKSAIWAQVNTQQPKTQFSGLAHVVATPESSRYAVPPSPGRSIRDSRFREGSLNDRPSLPPPPSFLGIDNENFNSAIKHCLHNRPHVSKSPGLHRLRKSLANVLNIPRSQGREDNGPCSQGNGHSTIQSTATAGNAPPPQDIYTRSEEVKSSNLDSLKDKSQHFPASEHQILNDHDSCSIPSSKRSLQDEFSKVPRLQQQQISRTDLSRLKKLSKRVSNLESKLQAARQELANSIDHGGISSSMETVVEDHADLKPLTSLSLKNIQSVVHTQSTSLSSVDLCKDALKNFEHETYVYPDTTTVNEISSSTGGMRKSKSLHRLKPRLHKTFSQASLLIESKEPRSTISLPTVQKKDRRIPRPADERPQGALSPRCERLSSDSEDHFDLKEQTLPNRHSQEYGQCGAPLQDLIGHSVHRLGHHERFSVMNNSRQKNQPDHTSGIIPPPPSLAPSIRTSFSSESDLLVLTNEMPLHEKGSDKPVVNQGDDNIGVELKQERPEQDFNNEQAQVFYGAANLSTRSIPIILDLEKDARAAEKHLFSTSMDSQKHAAQNACSGGEFTWDDDIF